MAVVSSHTLNSVDGTHAGGIAVGLYLVHSDGRREPVFETEMDAGGRLSQTVDAPVAGATYELVFQTGDYFTGRSQQGDAMQVLREVVIRFEMPDPEGLYHMPLMLAPNSYSVWWSS